MLKLVLLVPLVAACGAPPAPAQHARTPDDEAAPNADAVAGSERARLRGMFLNDPVAALAEVGITSKDELGQIMKRIDTTCSQVGCTVIAAKPADDTEVATITADNPVAPDPVPEPTPDPPKAPSFWCVGVPSANFGICTHDMSACDALRDYAVARAPDEVIGLCAEQDIAACFRVRSKLSGKTEARCAPSLSTCGTTRTATNRTDFEILSDCKAVKAQ